MNCAINVLHAEILEIEKHICNISIGQNEGNADLIKRYESDINSLKNAISKLRG